MAENKLKSGSYYTHNIFTLLQDYGSSSYYPNIMNQANNRYKKIAYSYDLISGKVNMVAYQPGYVNPVTNQWVNNPDRFYHRYSYDVENKLTEVYTSHDSLIWERDAAYQYYKHGPLARTVLGNQHVQGVDYAYTLQGWLKGVNATAVGDGSFDIGADGKAGSPNSLVARDVFGMALNYCQTTVNGVAVSDYKSINTGTNPFVTINNGNTFTGRQLFNGNISSVLINLPSLGEAKLYQYGYDQLNRLLAVDVYEGISNSANTFTPIALSDYKERLTYSANGNIKSYQRNGTGASMNLNNYTYNYTPGSNKLAAVINAVNGQTKTYSYDAIGNTTADGMQGATNIVWNVYGKVKSLTNAQGQNVSYTYDAGGNRISKAVAGATEWYVKDASGNTMATYTKSSSINSNRLTVTEWYKYGSGLLSINTLPVDMEQPPTGDTTGMRRGYDGYILTDHLGNTRAILSDRKLQYSANGTTVAYYIADVKSATYYSAYGATAKTYNQQPVVAFNGQRKSSEIGADAQTALYWEYNGDVGRRWNVDPRPNVSISPYNCFSGNPVLLSDILGDTAITGRPVGRNFDNYEKSRKDGYQSKKDIGDGQYLVVDNNGDRFITYEQKELVKYHNDLEAWETTLYYWSERPQKKGEEYAEGAHWVKYKDDLQERAQGMIDLVETTGTIVTKFAMYAPTFFAGGGGGVNLVLKGWQWRAGIETGSQLVVNGGNWRNLDVADIGFTAFFNPVGNSTLGGAIDVKPFASQNKFSFVGYNKDVKSALVDFGFKYAFGGNGLHGSVTNSIIRNSGSQAYTAGQQTVIKETFRTIIAVPSKAVRSALKENTGL